MIIKMIKKIKIKSADKSAVAVVWDREYYIIEAEKKLGDEKSMKKFLTMPHL